MPSCRFIASAAALCLACVLPANAQQAQAVRAWDRPVGPTIADQQGTPYRFETVKMSSEDGKRHYKIQIGIPARSAPASGYPVIYMVDGNAAVASIDMADLQAIDALSPPVLVAIGYDIDTRHDVIARAFDYTPPVIQDGVALEHVEERGRRGGGADIFLDYIETRIKPEVESLARIDRSRQTLWGHSYGGLFTLHAFFTHTDRYQRYVAGDPSLWWHDGVLVRTAQAFDPARGKGRKVAIMAGGGRPRTVAPAGATAAVGASAATPSAATPAERAAPTPPAVARDEDPRAKWSVQDLAKSLQDAGLDVTFERFADMSHGQMLAVSLKPALRIAAQP